MNAAPAVTVLFATHNGGAVLQRTLEAFRALQAPPGGWQLRVVDNCSTDDTPERLRALQQAGSLPLTVLHEARQGKNHALNTGLQGVNEGLVVFTDDDVLPAPQWLCLLAAAADAQPGFDLFGGAIVPDWPAQPPPWLQHTTNLGMLYAATPPHARGPVAAGAIWGPNMAVRARALPAGDVFNTRVGPDGSAKYAMGSETELLNRLERDGHRAWFEPEAMVRHQIRPAQLARSWVLQRYFRFGRSAYLHDHRRNPDDAFIFGVERWLRVQAVRAWCRSHWLGLTAAAADRERIRAEERLQFVRGQIFQSGVAYRESQEVRP
jgi:glycosyltransferase involved in cell wall biosynthesis